MPLPAIGQPAPDFTLPADSGEDVTLSALTGTQCVIYFYPRDNTEGCTIEAQDFTSLAAQFAAAGTRVLGISKDSLRKHANFRKKYDLTVTLLSDAEDDVCERYGVWQEKQMYGKSYMGIARTTLLIDAEGRVAQVWEGVKVAGHAAEVLAAADALSA